MPITQPPLPYKLSALEPYISKETLDVHYNGHHKTYVDTLNKLILETQYQDMLLEKIVTESKRNGDKKIFNNASQAWNHTFYWNSMTPTQDQKPSREFDAQLAKNFETFDGFKETFNTAGKDLFGSGWVWLVADQNQNLEILKGKNADNPLVHGKTALLTCDVWEHAYYLDRKNKRPDYINSFWSVVNWKFVEDNFNQSLSSQTGAQLKNKTEARHATIR